MPYRLQGVTGDHPPRIDLPPGVVVLGSGSACDVRLRDPTVSKRHARLETTPDGLVVHDLGSKNGIFTDGQRVEEATARDGTVLSFGRVVFRVEMRHTSDLELAWSAGARRSASTASRPVSNEPNEPNEPTGFDRTDETLGLPSPDLSLLKLLPRLLRHLDEGSTTLQTAQIAGAALFQALPLTRLAIDGGRDEDLLFEARRGAKASEETADTPGDPLIRSHLGRRTRLVATLVEPVLDRRATERWEALEPLVEGVVAAIDLAAGRLASRESPPPSARSDSTKIGSARAARPEPATVVPAVEELYDQAERVARGEVSVLIGGESGSGKEVLARFIHDASPRRERAFVALNCAALPQDLLEAELFGVEKGAATGVEARPGTFELADRGTLLLDEIGDMALGTQAKLLRVLQEQQIFRVGGTAPRPARVRVIAATNRDLRTMVDQETFRLDLYHRLAGWRVELPPLRDRVPDIANLTIHFLEREAARRGLRVAGLSRSALRRLEDHPWPGNVRQLQQEIARAVLFLDDGDVLDARCLSNEIRQGSTVPARTLAERLAEVERQEIRRALEASPTVGAAADALGVHRATLYRRMAALGLDETTEDVP